MLPRPVKFILRPFAGIIRYGSLKLMKRMRPPNDQRPIIATASHLLEEFITPAFFKFFQDEKFRELAKFKKLPVSEHDRIFNELEVAGVGMAIFYIRAMKSLVRPEDYHFWQDVEEHLPKQQQRILMGYGVDSGNAKLMRELIEMRCREYQKYLGDIIEVNQQGKEDFRELPPQMQEVAGAIQAIAFGTTDHIRRGKLEPGDPLIKYLAEWLFSLQRTVGKFIRRL